MEARTPGSNGCRCYEVVLATKWLLPDGSRQTFCWFMRGRVVAENLTNRIGPFHQSPLPMHRRRQLAVRQALQWPFVGSELSGKLSASHRTCAGAAKGDSAHEPLALRRVRLSVAPPASRRHYVAHTL